MDHPREPDILTRLLDAALLHVAFDGWSETTFRAAAADAGVDTAEARRACPRGALDLAVAYHREGDAAMLARLAAEDLSGMRFRDRVAHAVRCRIEAIPDKEAARRGAALFALPIHGAEGARLIWDTADAIWTGLGDSSEDVNWYTKRATLAGVIGASVLYWLGDDSADSAATWAFIDRRIDGVMRIEQAKSAARKTPVLRGVLALGAKLGARVRKPGAGARADLPGYLPDPQAAPE